MRHEQAPERYPAALRVATVLLVPLLLAGCAMVEAEARRAAGGLLADVQRTLDLPDIGVDTTRVLLAAAGVLLLVAGWKLHRFLVALPGFAVFGSLAAILTSQVTDNTLTVVIAAVIAGALGAWVALSLFRLGVFVSGALGGIVVVDRAWALTSPLAPPFYIILAGAVGGGLLLLALMGVWLPVVSAALGAALIGAGLGLEMGWMAALFGLGILVQSGVARALGENAFRRPPKPAR